MVKGGKISYLKTVFIREISIEIEGGGEVSGREERPLPKMHLRC